jgi:hypothetical protein
VQLNSEIRAPTPIRSGRNSYPVMLMYGDSRLGPGPETFVMPVMKDPEFHQTQVGAGPTKYMATPASREKSWLQVSGAMPPLAAGVTVATPMSHPLPVVLPVGVLLASAQ